MRNLILLLLIPCFNNVCGQIYTFDNALHPGSMLTQLHGNLVLIQPGISDKTNWLVLDTGLNILHQHKTVLAKSGTGTKSSLIPFNDGILNITQENDTLVHINKLNEFGIAAAEVKTISTRSFLTTPLKNPELTITSSFNNNQLLIAELSSSTKQFVIRGLLLDDKLNLLHQFEIQDSYNAETDRLELIKGEISGHFTFLRIRQPLKNNGSISYWRIDTENKRTGTGQVSWNDLSLHEIRTAESAGLFVIAATATGHFGKKGKNGLFTSVFNYPDDSLLRQTYISFNKRELKNWEHTTGERNPSALCRLIRLENIIPKSADSIDIIARLIDSRDIQTKIYDTAYKWPTYYRGTNYFPDSLPPAGISAFKAVQDYNRYDIRVDRNLKGFTCIFLSIKINGTRLTSTGITSYFSPLVMQTNQLAVSNLYVLLPGINKKTYYGYCMQEGSPEFGKISITDKDEIHTEPISGAREVTIRTGQQWIQIGKNLYCVFDNKNTGKSGLLRITY